MLRYVALGIIATSLIIVVQLFQSSQQEDSQSSLERQRPPTAANAIPAPAQNQNGVLTKSEEVTGEIQATSPIYAETANEQEHPIADTHSSTVQRVWEEDLEAPLVPTRFSNKGINVRALKLNRDHLTQASRGSELSIPIPQTGRDYTMAVTQVGQHQNGDKTLKGHIKGNAKYAVVMTQGARATFATVNTPDGSFLLEANENQGWILATTDLNGLVDPNLVDYMIPEISR